MQSSKFKVVGSLNTPFGHLLEEERIFTFRLVQTNKDGTLLQKWVSESLQFNLPIHPTSHPIDDFPTDSKFKASSSNFVQFFQHLVLCRSHKIKCDFEHSRATRFCILPQGSSSNFILLDQKGKGNAEFKLRFHASCNKVDGILFFG